MDSAKLILTGAVSPPTPLVDLTKIGGMSEEKKKQVAKDFESVFINKLLEGMRNTIGEWGFEKDGVSTQIQGIFSIYLSQYIADNGGFGLWKDIYQFLDDLGQSKATTETFG